jgi:FkbM family methyltransferase
MSIFPIESITSKFGVAIRGVIQVGAHSGGEVAELRRCGVERIHLIEANSELIPSLEELASNSGAGITISNVAISDENGFRDFHITSFSQSSSLRKLAGHKIIYPKIKEVRSVRVPTETLDANVAKCGLDLNLYNCLFIDVQGAELDVLRGAPATLNHIDMIVCEVNFAELYAGCAQIEDLDVHLFDAGFVRVATETPHHKSWGDAIYLKSPLVTDLSLLAMPKRHCITMPSLGSNGRLANQLFQYVFLALYGLRSGCELRVPDFKAAKLIDYPLQGRPCPDLPRLTVHSNGDVPLLLEALQPPRDVAFWGYFQQISSAYVKHSALVRRMLSPEPALKAALDRWWSEVRSKYDRVTGLHIRRGDYKPYEGGPWQMFSRVPTAWYARFLEERAKERARPGEKHAVFVSTDAPEEKCGFPGFDILQDAVPLPPGIDAAAAELFGLSLCDEALYCNSSWSFIAALLASPSQAAYIADFGGETFIPFHPWLPDQDLWFPFETSRAASKTHYRQSSPAQQEQRLLDGWRTEAELAAQLRKPVRFALNRKFNALTGTAFAKRIVELLASKRRKPGLLSLVARSKRRFALSTAIKESQGKSSCEEISAAYR